ncbi:MAG TPA: Na+/H+ antiporter NhaC [Flavobacteriaceae bacterium]|nr:Na+/H+ antiporter NhaC [Flavobacteriaceae bacterium]
MKQISTPENKNLSLSEALIPIIILIGLLAYNIFFVESQEWFGTYTYQIILLIGGAVALIVGLFNKTSIKQMALEVWENLRSVLVPILILLLVGALAGTWKVSGVIPAMVYYGLEIINPSIFLPLTVIICCLVSLSTGSSWTTSATVGIALIGIGTAFGLHPGMVAGAVISGAYFGDKMSPLSDTTNLAPAMAGTDLYTHIRYMTITTVPTILLTLVIFSILSISNKVTGNGDLNSINSIIDTIDADFYITPWLFVVPVGVIVLVLFRVKPLLSLSAGVILAVVFAVFYQENVLQTISESNTQSVIRAIFLETEIPTDNERLERLYGSGGMSSMFWTIYLIGCAMVFGGVMDGIGALKRITSSLLKVAKSTFGLFASTVASCIGLNILASDQYLAIVIPGKMFKNAYEENSLAPENLSRTLEDSGTVTSALIPWNTCGAFHSGVLGVSVGDYFAFAFFNWLSPIMTLIIAGFSIKIRQLRKKD